MNQNMLDFWKNQPGGRHVPPSLDAPLEVIEGLPPEVGALETLLLHRQYSPNLGYKFESVRLNNQGHYAITVTEGDVMSEQRLKNHPLISAYSKATEEEFDDLFGHLGNSVKVCADYLFYVDGTLKSLSAKIKALTGWSMEIILLPPAADERDAKNLFVKQGDKVSSLIFSLPPHNLRSINSTLHEAGHTWAYFLSPDFYYAITQEVETDPDLIALREVVANMDQSISNDEVLRRVYNHPGFQKGQDLEMRLETDAWFCGITLGRLLGLGPELSGGSPAALEYIIYTLKTRFENLEP